MSVVGDSGAAGHEFGIAADQLLGLDALVHFQQIGIAVQVVKIFQQGKIQSLLHIVVRFILCQPGGQVNGQLFIADGHLQN